jgi:D-alanyl-lipoteichoic acid acyltransferase DltB (MBOAT superfamily)
MVFPTLNFMLFYLALWPAAWALVRAGRHSLHKLAIIAGSYFFYAFWSWKLAFLLLGSVLLNLGVGDLIGRAQRPFMRRAAVTLGVFANLSLLGFFKYYAWFSEELNALLTSLEVGRELPLLEIVLPIGISFFTFQGISYVVDLYRGDLDRSRPLIDVMLFISFFAHLIAGPIVRASKFLPQLERPPDPNRVFVGLGVLLIGWGVFKKAVIANWLAVELVDKAFVAPSGLGGADLLVAIYGYAVQIYCDFSAYSDIAIGVAALLGYRFQRNFNQPYRAVSIADFWRRWHISLSTWLRDYLFIPLGGSRRGPLRTALNIMIVMFLGGLWHGAAWSYAIWGTVHGLALMIERPFLGSRFYTCDRIALRILRTLIVVVFVSFAWLLFRLPDFGQVQTYLAALVSNWNTFAGAEAAMTLVAYSLPVVIYHLAQFGLPASLRPVARTWIYGGLLAMIALNSGVPGAFIYFQF